MGPARLILNPNAGGCNAGYWQSGIYLEHVPTGLFVYGAYGREFLNTFAGFNNQPDHWMVKAGLRERWHPLGHTVLYGAYAERNDMFNEDILEAPTGTIPFDTTSTQIREWSLGVVQEIDAAAMSLWVQYDHFDAGISGCTSVGGFEGGAGAAGTCNGPASLSLDSFQLVKFGGLINF